MDPQARALQQAYLQQHAQAGKDPVENALNGLGHWLGRITGVEQYQPNQNAYRLNTGPADQARQQQEDLAKSLINQMNGGGPQLAAAQERAATDRNIAQAYAMAQANPYDAGSARNAANAVAMANQEAAAQSAMLQMQQQLAAQQQLGGLLSGTRGQDINQSSTQLQADMARDQMGQSAFNNSANAGRQFLGGVLGGLGSAASYMGLGKNLLGGGDGGGPGFAQYPTLQAPVPMAYGGHVPQYAHGGPAPTHSITINLPNAYASTGGQVPGRARVDGDSYANDTVNARLSPGEIVLPRSVAEDEDAPEKARMFVEAIERKGRKGR